VAFGNLVASILHNLWGSAVIYCNHFTESTRFFSKEQHENETLGEKYHRQILSCANATGNSWFHILTGHLSLHIEHHLFPEMPSSRLQEIAPKVEAVCKKYGIPYNKGSFLSNYLSVIKQLIKCSFPSKGSRACKA